jgi:hypothetical protein
MIRLLKLPGAPQALKIAAAGGAEGARRGVAARELDRLIDTLLPGRAIVRLAGGRPVVRGADDIHMSLSHATGATALAAAPFPVGIDLECVDPELDALAVGPDLLGARDFAFLASQAEAKRLEHFYRLWTLKEAWLKRGGCTLAQTELPEVIGSDGRLDVGMSTDWLDVAGRRYCVGICWDAVLAPSTALASANCL